MRKFFNIFLFVLCTIAIAGCNDTESSESRLEIKAVNTNFQATGGKGYIQLQATGNMIFPMLSQLFGAMPTGVC